jgi:Flp pilus assembly protein CpaB
MQNTFKGKMTNSRGGTIALGVGAAILAAILLVVYLNRYRSSVNGANEATPVLVAKKLIPKGTSGTVIGETGAFQTSTIAKDTLKTGAISDPAYLVGRVTLTDILPSQQITTADLSAGTSDALPTKITGRQRAFAIPVDTAKGLVGLTAEGDHLDVYMSLGSGGGNVLTLLAPDVIILRAPGAPNTNGTTSSDSNIMVLKAPAGLAQKIAFASDNGALWFLLRPAAGAKAPPARTITVQDLINQAKANNK